VSEPQLKPFEVLYEEGSLPRTALPDELGRLHGGDLGFDEPCLYANFVATLDGVVAIPSMPDSNEFIARGSDPDRFLMGLLRALADLVFIGAGVLRASPRGTWQAPKVYPPAANSYAELREQLGLPARTDVAVLTGSGSVDPAHPLFAAGALVLTSEAGAERLAGRLPETSSIVALGGSQDIPARVIVDALFDRGYRRVLSEAGPHAFGDLLRAGVVDELFLTSSPVLVGETGPGSRLRLVEATDLVGANVHAHLLSLRRHGSHLFHRYAID
jgi:riboflavin biosynthesis pyrimidine reductase